MDELEVKKKIDIERAKFTDEEVALARRKMKTNLFFLCYSILGYQKLTQNLHLDFCIWAKKTLLAQYREALLPRSHYKSTVFTIGDSIQIVLPDDVGDQPYPRNLGTSARLLISHETSEAATRFLHSITSHFTTNPLLLAFFPECMPNPRIHRINKLELELPRNSIWSEPTIDTVGVAGRSQGRHYNYIKCDDIYGAAARDSKAERESTILWVDNLQSLLISPRTDHIDFVGTRWAHDDVYAHLHKVYGNRLVRYIRSCEEKEIIDGKETGRKVPIFPEEFSPESLEILKRNRIVWNAQYANNPFEGGSVFQEEWLKYYNWKRFSRELVIFEGENGAETRTIDIESLDICILYDPAMENGLGGYVITGTDDKMNIYILKAEKKTWDPPEFVDILFKDILTWKPRAVYIEDVLFSGLYQHWLHTEQQVRGIKFRVEGIKIGKTEKPIRVAGLSNYFAARQIYFNAGMTDLIEEYREFGATDNYHMLDAMSMGTKKDRDGRQIWRAGVNKIRLDANSELMKKLMANRDPITGYGSY
jgi:hypothetical protein